MISLPPSIRAGRNTSDDGAVSRAPRDGWLARALPSIDAEALKRRSTMRCYAAGQVVPCLAAPPESVYFLEAGLLRVHHVTESGREITLGFIRPGELFGEVAFLVGARSDASTQAFRPSIVWCMRGEVVLETIARRPQLALEMARALGARLRRAERRLATLALSSVRARVAEILLDLAEDFGANEGSALVVALDLSQEDLARLIGCSRQTVNAELGALEAAGVLRYTRRRLTLSNLTALTALAS